MKIADPLMWKRRASILYAVGTWTMLGGVAYYHFSRRGEEVQAPQEEVNPNPNQRRVVYTTENARTVLTYREENYIVITWLNGLYKYFFGGSQDK